MMDQSQKWRLIVSFGLACVLVVLWSIIPDPFRVVHIVISTGVLYYTGEYKIVFKKHEHLP